MFSIAVRTLPPKFIWFKMNGLEAMHAFVYSGWNFHLAEHTAMDRWVDFLPDTTKPRRG